MFPLELTRILLAIAVLWMCIWLFILFAMVALPFVLFFAILWRMDASWNAGRGRLHVDSILRHTRFDAHR